jgi:hypothetical protein
MGCHKLVDGSGKVIGIVTCSNVYSYKGFLFEMHHFCGPTRLKRNGEHHKYFGPRFWKVFEEWFKLTDKQKAKTFISG